MRITVVGAGNMGASTARGLLASKCCEPQELHISDPSSAKLQDFKLRGVATFSNNIEAAKGSRWVMVFVKPWLVELATIWVLAKSLIPKNLPQWVKKPPIK